MRGAAVTDSGNAMIGISEWRCAIVRSLCWRVISYIKLAVHNRDSQRVDRPRALWYECFVV